MGDPSSVARVFRFGAFTFDEQSGELHKNGVKIRLADQPIRVLRLVVDRAGDVVTREEIRAHLWSSDTFVSFDVGLNSAVRKLRQALGDSAENPRFVETLPRRGYRFIAPVERLPGSPQPPVTEIRSRNRWQAAAVALAVTAASALAAIARLDPSDARSPVNAAAESAYKKGLVAAGAQTADGYTKAVKYFEDAVVRQPNFAEAYSLLAEAQMQLLFFGPVPPREVVPKAEAAVRRALQLDETLASAHRVLGTILQNYYWRWEEARAEFRRGAEVQKNADEHHRRIGQRLIREGRFDEAAAEFELARKADPLSPVSSIQAGIFYRKAGQHDRAVTTLRKAIDIAPTFARTQFQLGITLLQMGRADEAIGAFEAAARLTGGNQRFHACVGIAYAAAGRFADARRILDELETRARHEYVSAFGIALIYDALGDAAAALSAFEVAYQDRAVELAEMTEYPPFTTIGSDPRYQALTRTIGAPR
jgi:DNA-binding winged helix-turn-helix (wHTH) protein/Flp pilus assembly protein TadD